MYIYELQEWPKFYWDMKRLAAPLASVRHRQGKLVGHMKALGFNLQREAELETLTADVLKTSEIEGEKLNAEQVRSSIARRLGVDIGGLNPVDRNVEGVVEMMLDATRGYASPLSAERLFAWNASLFPTGYSGMTKIRTGAWRDDGTGPMQVVSGPMGKERVHFEAPNSQRLPTEMGLFFDWFEGDSATDPVLKAGLAHIWFVTIHPFEDGNGRIARAIADMALARSENSPQRFYSMSAQIRQERAAYYRSLEETQKGTIDITPWMDWFLGCLGRAIDGSQTTLGVVFAKARFWERIQGVQLNGRQRLIINRLLDGFEGKLTTSKYARLAKCSQDTAHRDVLSLVDEGVLVRNPEGGRSTSYSLAPEHPLIPLNQKSLELVHTGSRSPVQEENNMSLSSIVEHIQVLGTDLVGRVNSLIREGNVRRIVIRDEHGHTFMEIPVTVAAVGVIAAPLAAALGTLAAMVAKFTIVVERNSPAV